MTTVRTILPDGKTHIGMAHFAGTGPAGEICGNCKHWSGEFDPYRVLQRIKPGLCRKHAERRQTDRKTAPVPHDASACRHFEGKQQER